MGQRPSSLTRESIVDTALVLVDRVGIDGLTTRGLASELGVKSPALYWHFADKGDLVEAMGDAIILRAGMGPPHTAETWQEWMTRRAYAYRTEVLKQRDGARLVASVRQASAETRRLFGEEIQAMIGLGFDAAFAMRTIAVVTHYVAGFVLNEQAALASRGTGRSVVAVDDDPLSDDVFGHGLTVIITGTEHHFESNDR